MARKILIANVGERDLYYNVGDSNEPRFENFEWGKPGQEAVAKWLGCKEGARYIAGKIWENLRRDPSVADRLRYPILKTALDVVLTDNDFLDELVLVVTDQPGGTYERFRCRDSLYTGEIIKELIQRDYGNRVKRVSIHYYRENPANREQGYAFFGELLPRVAPEAEVGEFHAVLSGGTPALNDGLQEQALRLYKTRCRFYEVLPPGDEESLKGAEKGELQPISAKPFLRDLAIGIIEQLLDRYDYSGALEVLDMFRPVKFWDQTVEDVLRHAERRLDLDLHEATRVLAKHKTQTGSPLSKWYQAVSNPDPLRLLVEVYHVAVARCEHREYADFLWRLRLILESSKEEIYSHLGNTDWREVHSVHAKLGRLVGLAGRVLHPDRGLGVRSPRGISERTVANAFGKNTSVDAVVTALETLVRGLWGLQKSAPFPENPYEEINAFIKEALKRP